MLRAANLFDRIHEPENLRLAFHKAARGRRSQAVVTQFAADLDARISELAKGISKGTFPIGRFQQFLIRDPKERVIAAPCFDERLLHHAIMNLCEPILDRWLIDDTFACRNGKGREAAILRALHYSRNATWCSGIPVAGRWLATPMTTFNWFIPAHSVSFSSSLGLSVKREYQRDNVTSRRLTQRDQSDVS